MFKRALVKKQFATEVRAFFELSSSFSLLIGFEYRTKQSKPSLELQGARPLVSGVSGSHGNAFQVYCDKQTDGEGWTLV